MASHDISANVSSTIVSSPAGTGVHMLGLAKQAPSEHLLLNVSTASMAASSSPPSGPIRPSSGLVYPLYL